MGLLRALRLPLVLLVACLAVSRLFEAVLSPYYTRILTLAGINVILAVSLNLVNGMSGQFSIGHAGFMAVGGYGAAAFSFYLGPRFFAILGSPHPGALPVLLLFVLALVVGGLLSALAGLLVGLPTLRLRGDYLAIATLAFGEIIRVVILNIDAIGGARGFTGVASDPVARYAGLFTVSLAAALSVVALHRILVSAHGRAFLSVREDEVAAQAIGVDTTRYKVIAFVISSFLAGIAGGLFGYYNQYLNTNSFTFLKSIEVIIMVVLGGMGSLSGSVMAAVILTVLPELLRPIHEYRMVLYSFLLIVLMIVRPQGIFGTRELTWTRIRALLVRPRARAAGSA